MKMLSKKFVISKVKKMKFKNEDEAIDFLMDVLHLFNEEDFMSLAEDILRNEESLNKLFKTMGYSGTPNETSIS